MSDQTEAKQEYPSQLFVTIAGNHPMAEAALASVLSGYFNDLGIAGRRQAPEVFDPKFAVDTVNGLASNQQNSINIMASSLTMQSIRGEYQVWDWPAWGDASQPWTALVDDSLRNLWTTFTSQQKRAIYESFNALNIEVEGEDEPMSLEHALSIISSDNTETYVHFQGTQEKQRWDEVKVDGRVDSAELRAILFIMENAIPDAEGNPTMPTTPSSAPETAEVAELKTGENPMQNGAHAAPELPDGREVPDVDAPVTDAASAEHNPDQVKLADGVPSVKSTDPVLAPVSEANVSTNPADAVTLASPPASGTVTPVHRDSVED